MALQELWRPDLRTAATPVSWTWHGFLGPGLMTLLTSQWKSGKTTLISLLLGQRARGGVLLGQNVTAGGAVIVSEESATLWDRRSARLGIADNVCFFCRPFRGKPRMDQWRELLDRIAALHQEKGLDLVVIDSLATMLPVRNENVAAGIVEALDPLRELTDRGLASLILHHPRKGVCLEGQAARGSGALDAFVDITIEMNQVRGVGCGRRRRLSSLSRFEETPRRLLIELNDQGTEYVVLDEPEDPEFLANWDYLRMVLEDAKAKATRQELLADWPADFPKPAPATLWRWLDRAVADKLVERTGDGRSGNPFCYWLPAKQEEWSKDPLHALLHPGPAELRELMRRRGSA